MPIDVRTIFCDDIRREDNGKMMLIGVYVDDLVPGAIPSSFPMSIWVSIKGETIKKGALTVELLLPGGGQVKMVGEIEELPADVTTSFTFIGFPVEIKETGEIKVQLTFGDNKPIDAGRLTIRAPAESATNAELTKLAQT
jgi:hypothetical protein